MPTPTGERWPIVAAKILWASPCSMVGLLVGGVGCLSGGRARRRGRTIEFWGGYVRWQLRRLPIGQASAMTIGHVILGQDEECLDASRRHELVHVRQFERWGPLFLPAYFGVMPWLWFRGRHLYFDNPFEIEAYRESDGERFS
jgi:hypothetical protein